MGLRTLGAETVVVGVREEVRKRGSQSRRMWLVSREMRWGCGLRVLVPVLCFSDDKQKEKREN